MTLTTTPNFVSQMDNTTELSHAHTNVIGFGGGCHWCTEAVFQSLLGVKKTEQGWIASESPDDYFSEAVIVHYNAQIIQLDHLIRAHLHTHSSMSKHSMRKKYRSAVYFFQASDEEHAQQIISKAQLDFPDPIVTRVLAFKRFKPSPEQYQNYYRKNSNRPFCQTYITPKFQTLMKNFHQYYQEVETLHIK